MPQQIDELLHRLLLLTAHVLDARTVAICVPDGESVVVHDLAGPDEDATRVLELAAGRDHRGAVVHHFAQGIFVLERDPALVWTAHERISLQHFIDLATCHFALRAAAQCARARVELMEAMIDRAGDGLLAVDRDRGIVLANQFARGMLGVSEGDRVMPSNWVERQQARHEDGTPLADDVLNRELDRLVFSIHPDGAAEPRWIEMCGRPVADHAGDALGTIGVFRDVTDQVAQRATAKRLSAELGRAEQLWRAVLSQIPNTAVFLVDRSLRYVAADGPIMRQIMRRENVWGEFVGRKVTDIFTDERGAMFSQFYERAFDGETVASEHASDNRILELTSVPIYENDTVSHAMLFIYDRTERHQQRALLDTTLETISDGVLVLDEHQHVRVVNRACCEMLALPRERLLTMKLAELPGEALTEESRVELLTPVRRVIRRRVVALANGAGTVVTMNDITAEHDMVVEHDRLAHVDQLTQIPNRRSAERSFARQLAQLQRGQGALSVVLLDIDHFKSINDRFGHNAGDEVLRSVAHAIASCGRSTDMIARWGGEEFIAILPAGVEGAHMFAERAREAVARIADDRLPYVTISAGVAECTTEDAAEAALSRADERLYTAKREGRNRVASTLEDFDLATVLARRITREILLNTPISDD